MAGKLFLYATFGILGGAVLLGFFIFPAKEELLWTKKQENPFAAQGVPPALKEPIEKISPFFLPSEIRGVYLTRWSAGSAAQLNQLLFIAKEKSINAVVIDIKDFSGFLAYDTGVALAKEIGAEQENIKNITEYLELLHNAGLYTIARITVFQDPVLAASRPDLAIKRLSSDKREVWTDHKGLAWMDPASLEVWEYNTSIAKDALQKGFDEVNFDYIRFPSDGDIFDTKYPFWDEKTPLEDIIRSFFAYLKEELQGQTISVDLFGLTAANTWDDMGIGQILEDAFLYFDFVSPMVYPSHFAEGFLGLEHPDEHPYEIVNFSMAKAKKRLMESGLAAKLRPWLQYFDLAGSNTSYTPAVVREQILATQEALGEDYTGYLLWNSSNIYPNQEIREIVMGPIEENSAKEQLLIQ
ncbi:MAG: putative glycoside hydrolase [bacterium]|nr:putative glycoside hydrolase [bacterium]